MDWVGLGSPEWEGKLESLQKGGEIISVYGERVIDLKISPGKSTLPTNHNPVPLTRRQG